MLRLELREQRPDFRCQLLGGAGGLGDGAAVRPLPLPVEARLEALQEGRQLGERQEGGGGRAEPGDTRLLPHRQPRVPAPRHRDAEHARRPPGEAIDLRPDDVADAHRPTIRKRTLRHRLGEDGGRRRRRGGGRGRGRLTTPLQFTSLLFLLIVADLRLLAVGSGGRGHRGGRGGTQRC